MVQKRHSIVFRGIAVLLLLTLAAVHSLSCRAKVEREGPRKETLEPLPPKSSDAKIQKFEHLKAVSEVSAEHAKHLVHIGKARRELEKVYYGDGGFSTIGARRYVLRDQPKDGPEGHVLKVRVLFRPANVTDEIYRDPKKFREWMREQKGYGSQDDIVVDISAPYWERPYCD